MQGKYSPTVSSAYDTNIRWFRCLANGDMYDDEGYDRYGYNRNDIDRAGNHEIDYALDDDLHNDVYLEWGSNGTRPVKDTE